MTFFIHFPHRWETPREYFTGNYRRLAYTAAYSGCEFAWTAATNLQAKKNPAFLLGFSLITSLTITYFHTGCSTIIGAELFHGPVRDGKGWYQLAMVIRHDLYRACPRWGDKLMNLEEVSFLYFYGQRLYHNKRIQSRQRVLLLSHNTKVIGTSRTGN